MTTHLADEIEPDEVTMFGQLPVGARIADCDGNLGTVTSKGNAAVVVKWDDGPRVAFGLGQAVTYDMEAIS